MKTTLIVNATPNPDETEALAYYSKHAGAILKAHNGKLLNRYKTMNTITKEKVNTTFMMMEFEDEKIIEALSSDAAYQELIPYRNKAFLDITISFLEVV